MADEELYQQQLNEERAKQVKAKKTAAKISQKTPEITSVEFALIGFVAIIKDAIDVLGTGLIVGALITIFINVPCTLILWFWCVIKLHKFPFKRFIGAGLAEFIPFVGALPFWTAFVVSLYLEQNGYFPKFLSKIKK